MTYHLNDSLKLAFSEYAKAGYHFALGSGFFVGAAVVGGGGAGALGAGIGAGVGALAGAIGGPFAEVITIPTASLSFGLSFAAAGYQYATRSVKPLVKKQLDKAKLHYAQGNAALNRFALESLEQKQQGAIEHYGLFKKDTVVKPLIEASLAPTRIDVPSAA